MKKIFYAVFLILISAVLVGCSVSGCLGVRKTVREISATYEQNEVIYEGENVNVVEERGVLTVQCLYTTGDSALITNEYALTGTLTAGTSVITVTYRGQYVCTFRVEVTEVGIREIRAEYEQQQKVFPHYEVSDLPDYGDLSVWAVYVDGSEELLDPEKAELSFRGTLEVGTSKVAVVYQDYIAFVNVEVSPVEITSIGATWEQSEAIYPYYDVANLESYGTLTVTAYYNDGTSEVLQGGYTLSGDFAQSGEVTVGYAGCTATVTTEVTSLAVVSVSATWRQSETIFPYYDVANLESYGTLTVTAKYNDGSEETVTGYTLQGDFSLSREVTVGYAGCTATVTVEVTAVVLTDIRASFEQTAEVLDTTPLEDLGDYGILTVWAIYNDGTSVMVQDYTLSGTLVAGECYPNVIYRGYIKQIKVYVTASVVETGIRATYTQEKALFAGECSLSDVSEAGVLLVELTYSDGTATAVTDYTLSGGNFTTAGTTQVTITYGGYRTTFSVTISPAVDHYAPLVAAGNYFGKNYDIEYTDGAVSNSISVNSGIAINWGTFTGFICTIPDGSSTYNSYYMYLCDMEEGYYNNYGFYWSGGEMPVVNVLFDQYDNHSSANTRLGNDTWMKQRFWLQQMCNSSNFSFIESKDGYSYYRTVTDNVLMHAAYGACYYVEMSDTYSGCYAIYKVSETNASDMSYEFYTADGTMYAICTYAGMGSNTLKLGYNYMYDYRANYVYLLKG